jgi:hypothetical protein
MFSPSAIRNGMKLMLENYGKEYPDSSPATKIVFGK